MRERSPLKHAGPAGEDAVLHATFDAGDLEDRTALGGQVAAEQTDPPVSLKGLSTP